MQAMILRSYPIGEIGTRAYDIADELMWVRRRPKDGTCSTCGFYDPNLTCNPEDGGSCSKPQRATTFSGTCKRYEKGSRP